MNSTTINCRKRNAMLHNTSTTQYSISKSRRNSIKKLAELRAELGLSNDLRHKLERKTKIRQYELILVTCLENENNLLENKQKELEGTIQGLLESKEAFVKAYEQFCKQRLDVMRSCACGNWKKVVCSSVAGLKRKMDEVSTFEKLFIGSLGIVIKKIQDAVTPMSEEDRKTFTSLVEGQEEWQSIRQSENLRMPDIVQITRKDSHLKSSMIEESTGSYHTLGLCCKEHKLCVTRQQIFTNTLQSAKSASLKVQEDSIKSSMKKDKINCCASEANTSSTLQLQYVYSSSPSACSVPQRDADNASVSAAAAKDDIGDHSSEMLKIVSI
ncbi:hypothetical protein RND71_023778 [Anisodus tanguticus]|uniref:Uncharacterized protein n=1 Tax=Anisodus tanguticus TaxID=243964 RepID=A0AAE1RUJ3_9SOLA|nr:hypothetical protein RND71_023778 [Anisodus tanguticus]